MVLSRIDRDMLLATRAMFEPPKPPEPPKDHRYVSDPVGWVRDKLGEHLWSKQREIVESVRDNRYTAVQSCHDAGKSFSASRLVSWWLSVHPQGEAFAVTTAPTAAQVSAILWREIRRAHRKGKLDGYITSGAVPEWKLPDGEPIGYGRKPADEDQAAFQGIHATFPLIIVDEACGVPKNLFDAVDALATNENARVLAIGNPDDPASHFANICKPGSGWNVITIDGLGTPNFTTEAVASHPRLALLFEELGLEPVDEHVPEALRPLLLSPLWVDERIHRWGIDSPLFTAKVRGLFPDVGDDVLIGPGLIKAAQDRSLAPDGRAVLGVDVARFGMDKTVIYVRRGPVIRLHGEYSKQPTTETTGRAIVAHNETHASQIRVDGVGVGAGVVDQLTEQGYPVLDMQAGAKPQEPDRFLNARSEWAWAMRERLEAGEIDLDPLDEDLAAQLGAIKFKYTSKGQIQIESKQDLRKRGMPSPDRADAAILTSVTPTGSELFRAINWRYWRPAHTDIPGQVDCGSRISTLAEGWRYGSLFLPSGEDAATDWAVGAIWCQTIGGDLLLLDLVRRRLGDEDPARMLAPLVRKHNADTVFVPRRHLTDTLRAQASRAAIGVTPVDAPDADLYSRALVASSKVVAGKVWLPHGAPWLPLFTAEAMAFPHTRAHGCVAVLALAAQVETTRWQPPPRNPASTPMDRYADDTGPDLMTIGF